MTHSKDSTESTCLQGSAISELISLGWAGYHVSGPGSAACQLRGTLEIFIICSWRRKKESDTSNNNFGLTTQEKQLNH